MTIWEIRYLICVFWTSLYSLHHKREKSSNSFVYDIKREKGRKFKCITSDVLLPICNWGLYDITTLQGTLQGTEKIRLKNEICKLYHVCWSIYELTFDCVPSWNLHFQESRIFQLKTCTTNFGISNWIIWELKKWYDVIIISVLYVIKVLRSWNQPSCSFRVSGSIFFWK